MFTRSVHPLDILLAVLAAATAGGALIYWLAITGRVQVDFAVALAFLLGGALAMMLIVGGLIWLAIRLFNTPSR